MTLISNDELTTIMRHVPAGIDRSRVKNDINTLLEHRENLRENRRLTPKERKKARKIAQKMSDLAELIGDLGGVGRDLKVLLRCREKSLRAELNSVIETIDTVTSQEWRGNPSQYKVETIDQRSTTWETVKGDDVPVEMVLVRGEAPVGPKAIGVPRQRDNYAYKVEHKWRGLSHQDWFIGYGLAQIYEMYFGEPAKSGRNIDGTPDGGFVKFACAVTAALGKPAMDETVLSALTRVRQSEWRE